MAILVTKAARRPLKRKPTKLERLRAAIAAHMQEQFRAINAYIADRQAQGLALPHSFPSWEQLGLGAIPFAERMTPILSAIWDESGQRFATRVGMDPNEWSVTNPHTAAMIQNAALAFCKETNASTSQDLDTALANLRKELHEGIVEKGDTIEQLTKRVQSVFDTATKSRARTIATSEASRAVHGAQQAAAYQSGVVTGWRWVASADACPVCLAIAARNPVVKLGQPFAVIGTNPHYSTILHPPAHPNCLLDVTPVVAPIRIAGIKAHYDGPVVRLCFSDGSDVTVTPHHMFLTPEGFAFAGNLMQGDDVLCYPMEKWMSRGGPDDDGMPTPISEIFDAMAKSSRVAPACVPVSPEYLHGDAALCQGNIHVVSADSLLRHNIYTKSAKPFGQRLLSGADVSRVGFTEQSDLATVLLALRDATDGGMGSTRESKALAFAHLRSPVLLGVRSSSDRYSEFEQMTADRSSSDAKSLSDCQFRFPGKISLCRVLFVDWFHHYGSVYDLQTATSLYLSGNGIITGNCNCAMVEVLDTDPQPEFGVTLHQPAPATEEEFRDTTRERRERDEAILAGSVAWGAAPRKSPLGIPMKRYQHRSDRYKAR